MLTFVILTVSDSKWMQEGTGSLAIRLSKTEEKTWV